ncbi:hypothetical protein JOQ06_026289 [Pogonophryne albipinna]|uniref:Transposase n=1 Tax=Pogonophryne albipinna TaxID=1090488 RepID=A0AAD6A6T7_9TELE|nr:hypothetical protein JOQ06_026289 [Pogonophryne albipinna]
MSSARQKSEGQRGGRSKTSPLPDPANATLEVAQATALDAELLQSMMESLKAEVFGKIDSLSSSLLKESIRPLQDKVEQHGQTVLELERAATDHSGRITELEATVSRLMAQAKDIDDRCEDLEGRSRRNNIRLVGISEGMEGPRPTEFIAKLLEEILRLDEKPQLDRAHPTLRDRPREGDTPRPFVVRVHYFHTRNEILGRAGDLSPLLCQGILGVVRHEPLI